MKKIKRGKFIVIAGPTGAGESSVTNGVLKKLKKTQRVITATSRKPRNQEKNGHDYFFFTTKQFKNKIKKGEFLEYTYVRNRQEYYGTLKKWVEDRLSQGVNLMANLDLVGTRFYKKHYQALTIFVKPEKFSLIKKRLLHRQPSINLNLLKLRLENAKNELKEAKYYDYVVVNCQGKLNQAIARTYKIIQKYLN